MQATADTPTLSERTKQLAASCAGGAADAAASHAVTAASLDISQPDRPKLLKQQVNRCRDQDSAVRVDPSPTVSRKERKGPGRQMACGVELRRRQELCRLPPREG